MVMAVCAADAQCMAWDDDQVALMRAAADQQVRRRSIHSNSGPGTARWFVGSEAANSYQESVLVGLYRDGLLSEAPGGCITLSARGRAKLTLHG